MLLPYGCDISFYDRAVDFEKMKAAGLQFVHIRAAIDKRLDRCFEKNVVGVVQSGMRFGLRHWFNPVIDPELQARTFEGAYKLAQGSPPSRGAATMRPLLPAVDVEDPAAIIPFEYRVRLRIFLEYIEQSLSVIPMIYTNFDYWTTRLGSAQWAVRYPLWIAHYKSGWPLVPLPWAPAHWLLWQFTRKGDGLYFGSSAKELDLNIYNPFLPNS